MNVETSRVIMEEQGQDGPIHSDHLREAYRRFSSLNIKEIVIDRQAG